MNDAEMLERVAAEVRGFVERKFAPMTADVTRLRDALEQQAEDYAKQIEALKRSIAGLELKQGPAGPAGKDGNDAPPADVDAIVSKVLAQIPEPKNGADGKDGRDGIDGANGKDGAPGADGKDGLPGKDGRDGKDGIDGKDGAAGLNGKDGADGRAGVGIARIELDPDMRHFDVVLEDGKRYEVQLPEGVKGESGKDGADGRDGKDGRDGLHGKDGRDGADGKDGAPGADGRNGIDGKDGAQGHRGLPGADGMDGKDGADGRDGKDGAQLDDFDAIIAEDGRTIELSFVLSDGLVKTKSLSLRGVPLDRGVHRNGAKYVQGDAVTYAGSIWIALCDTEKSPGNGSPDWRLAVKRGRDGKDAPGAEE